MSSPQERDAAGGLRLGGGETAQGLVGVASAQRLGGCERCLGAPCCIVFQLSVVPAGPRHWGGFGGSLRPRNLSEEVLQLEHGRVKTEPWARLAKPVVCAQPGSLPGQSDPRALGFPGEEFQLALPPKLIPPTAFVF